MANERHNLIIDRSTERNGATNWQRNEKGIILPAISGQESEVKTKRGLLLPPGTEPFPPIESFLEGLKH